uniref:Uncharacterized protein n=1 Tax=Trichogramma kaykai TaxID=54128 RepID=A0ABD2WXK6_9HYME
MVSILATFSAVAMALNGLILPIILDSVLPASTDRNRSFSYEPEIGFKFLSFSANSIENSTIYYGLCENQYSEQNTCIMRRVHANFWGVSPRVDECNVTLRSEPGDYVVPNDVRQRQNLTHEQVQNPVFSLANELIGICGRHNYDTIKCTQFKLGDKEINWFSVINVDQGQVPAIYNLPRDEGILNYMKYNTDNKPDFSSHRYLLKIGLDGKVKQFVKPDLQCPLAVAYNFQKIFEDSRGNYCTSFAYIQYDDSLYKHPIPHLKFQSNCFEPKDFKNPPVSKQKIEGK